MASYLKATSEEIPSRSSFSYMYSMFVPLRVRETMINMDVESIHGSAFK
jgi:hypothetical protein